MLKLTFHLVDERKLIFSHNNEFFDLAAIDPLFDLLPILLFLTDLEPEFGEFLDGLAILGGGGDGFDGFEGVVVEGDQNFASIWDDIKPHEAGRFLHLAQQGPCESPQEHGCRDTQKKTELLSSSSSSSSSSSVVACSRDKWRRGSHTLLTAYSSLKCETDEWKELRKNSGVTIGNGSVREGPNRTGLESNRLTFFET